MWDPFAEFQRTELSNGLEVLAYHWPDRPWEYVGFHIHSGAKEDPVGLEGTAHFVEHLVGEHAPMSSNEIYDFFQDHGGYANLGKMGYDLTRYSFMVPIRSDVMRKALSVFGEMLLSGTIEDKIEKQREIILDEFTKEYPTTLKREVHTRRQEAVFRGTWHERFITPMGTPESINSIAQVDLQMFFDTHYTPANLSVVAVGGLTLDEVVDRIQKGPFSQERPGVRNSLPDLLMDTKPLEETRFVLNMSDYVNIALHSGKYESTAKLPGNIPHRVVQIVSDMLQTILHDEVREKRRWAYSIGCGYERYHSFYKFVIGCESFKLNAMNSFESVVERCIKMLRNREDLFRETKHRFVASQSMLDLSGENLFENAMSEIGHVQRIRPGEEVLEEFTSVTMEDVRMAADLLQPEYRWTWIAQP